MADLLPGWVPIARATESEINTDYTWKSDGSGSWEGIKAERFENTSLGE